MRRTALLLFFLSGFSSLVLESIWIRMLTLVFGSTTFSISTVVAAFMGGLALGSFLIGKSSERISRPFLAYGICEGIIGVYALLFPLLLTLLPALYRIVWRHFAVSFYAFSLLRFGIGFLLLILPTTLMGGTLPLLSRHLVTRREEMGASIGTLYAVNTAGAVCGAFASGFLLMPIFGVSATNAIAVSIDLLLFAIVMAAAGREGGSARMPPPSPAQDPGGEPDVTPLTAGGYRSLLVIFALSGFISLVYQIVWSRSLILVIGSSIYAFAILLTLFLAGLAIGSFLYARYRGTKGDPLGDMAWIECGIGLFAFLGLCVIDFLPVVQLALFEWLAVRLTVAYLVKFLLAGAVIFLPTLGMGMIFPAVVRIYGERSRPVGRSVGEIYAVNTVGAIFGSFAGGFLFVPFLGLERSLLLATMASFLLGAALFLLRARHRGKGMRLALFPLLAVGTAIFLYRPWNLEILTAGTFRLSEYFKGREHLAPSPPPPEGRKDLSALPPPHGETLAAWESALLTEAAGRLDFEDFVYTRHEPVESIELAYYHEGISATVTTRGVRSRTYRPDLFWQHYALTTNGKTDASAIYLEALSPEGKVLRRGGIDLYGDEETQTLAGLLSILLHPAPRRGFVLGYGSGMSAGAMLATPIEHIDIAEIERGMVEGARFFAPLNHHAADDPRVTMIYNDGRNYLLATDTRYDVISSYPSNPWIAGIGSLFTREFFALARERLAPGGIFVQWFHLYEISPENVKVVLRTFADAFPHVVVFHAKLTGVDLLLVGSEQPIDLSTTTLEERMSLPTVRPLLDALHLHTPQDLLADLILVEGDVRAYAGEGPLNTDDNAYLEFSTPKDLVAYRRFSPEEIVAEMRAAFSGLDLLALSSPEKSALVAGYLRAGEHALADALLAQLTDADPETIRTLTCTSRNLYETHDRLLAINERLWTEVPRLAPGRDLSAMASALRRGKHDLALEQLRAAFPDREDPPIVELLAGFVEFLRGRPLPAFTLLTAALESARIKRAFPEAHLLLGWIHQDLHQPIRNYEAVRAFCEASTGARERP